MIGLRGWVLALAIGFASPAAAADPAAVALDLASARALVARFGAPTQPFLPPPPAVAAVEPLSRKVFLDLEDRVRWMGGSWDDGFAPPTEPDPYDPATLAATKTEEELVAMLAEVRPMFHEYPRLLAALALEDPTRGRQRILEHLRVHAADPSDNLRAWSPAMSSLTWIDPAPLDHAMLDAIACVIVQDPGHWFHYAYLAQAARARGRPEELDEVAKRLPEPLATTLRHYAWLMTRTAADLEADLKALGVPLEAPITPEVRAYVDGSSHWTPMDRLRDDVEIYGEVYLPGGDDPTALPDVYDWLWRGATSVAPVTTRDARFGVVWPEADEPVTLVLERGDQRWLARVSPRVADPGAATALFDQLVPAGQTARFQVAVAVRSERTGLMFGDPEGIPVLAALYRLDEPSFNLMQRLEPAAGQAEGEAPPPDGRRRGGGRRR